jgi:hypothetical protein
MVGITAKLMHDLSGGLRHAACIASRGRGKQRTAMAHLMRKESGEREEGAFDVFEDARGLRWARLISDRFAEGLGSSVCFHHGTGLDMAKQMVLKRNEE